MSIMSLMLWLLFVCRAAWRDILHLFASNPPFSASNPSFLAYFDWILPIFELNLVNSGAVSISSAAARSSSRSFGRSSTCARRLRPTVRGNDVKWPNAVPKWCQNDAKVMEFRLKMMLKWWITVSKWCQSDGLPRQNDVKMMPKSSIAASKWCQNDWLPCRNAGKAAVNAEKLTLFRQFYSNCHPRLKTSLIRAKIQTFSAQRSQYRKVMEITLYWLFL